jgi:hypothetical protein
MEQLFNFTSFADTLRLLYERFIALLPSLVAAVGLLLFGWLAGRLLAKWTVALVDRLAPTLEERAGRVAAARLGIERRLSEVIGTFIFWVVLIIAAAAATEALGLPVLASWVSRVSNLLPLVLVAGLIVLAGLVAGTLARDAISTATMASGFARGDLLGRAAQAVIVVAAIVTGMEQVGIDSQFLTLALTVALGAVLGGTALAFAIGAGPEASNIIAMHYVRLTYRPGQTVRLGDIQGRVRELTRNAVVLETQAGRLQIPGRLFSEQISAVLTSE